MRQCTAQNIQDSLKHKHSSVRRGGEIPQKLAKPVYKFEHFMITH
jgi:hypothetical protein